MRVAIATHLDIIYYTIYCVVVITLLNSIRKCQKALDLWHMIAICNRGIYYSRCG